MGAYLGEQMLAKFLSHEGNRIHWNTSTSGKYGDIQRVALEALAQSIRENGILQEFESKTLGRVRMPRAAAQFDRTPTAVREMAPALGADNAAVLGELGYGAEEIERLEKNGVLHHQPVKTTTA
jgi:hypothetical protein